jgi:hemoglobin-like flavoprotein
MPRAIRVAETCIGQRRPSVRGKLLAPMCAFFVGEERTDMTPQQIQLIKQSFALVAPIAPQAAELFYNRLFEIAPEVRGLFKGDMNEQGRKLMATIGVAVASLDRLHEIVPVVQELGRRHVRYGVKDEHYDIVAQALLWTLEKGLGPAFTAEVKEAWTSVYVVLAETMKKAGGPAAAPAE